MAMRIYQYLSNCEGYGYSFPLGKEYIYIAILLVGLSDKWTLPNIL